MHDASSGRNTKRKAMLVAVGSFHGRVERRGAKEKKKRTDSFRAQRKKQYKEKEKTYAQ